MKMKILIPLVLVFVGLLYWLLRFGRICADRDPNARAETSSTARVEAVPRINSNGASIIGKADGSDNMASLKLARNIAQLYERWTGGLPKDDVRSPSMADKDAALEAAKRRVQSLDILDINSSEIFLVGDAYIVCVPRYANPFYYLPEGSWNYGCWLGFDAWTGEHIGTQRPRDGGRPVAAISVNTGGDGTDESVRAYQERLSNTLSKLRDRIRMGTVRASDHQRGMIEPDEAVMHASVQVGERDYDREKPPWPILIDDMYIVTFWKRSEKIKPQGDFLYDSRVGIDASTGEFIALEIAPTP